VKITNAGLEFRVNIDYNGLVHRTWRDQMKSRRQVEDVIAVVRPFGRPKETFQRFDFIIHRFQHVLEIVMNQLKTVTRKTTK